MKESCCGLTRSQIAGISQQAVAVSKATWQLSRWALSICMERTCAMTVRVGLVGADNLQGSRGSDLSAMVCEVC